MIVAGVMSGSSLDGLDIAVVRFSENGFKLLESTSIPLGIEWRSRLEAFNELSTIEFLKLEQSFSNYLGKSISKYLNSLNIKVDLLGIHGHTIIHIPEKGLTHQIGHGGIISSITNMDTVSDFRMQDVSKNGIGTPLVSILEHKLLSNHDYYLNLGGIANITKKIDDTLIAYDICPCNQVLNYLSKKYFDLPFDENGVKARNGNIRSDIVDERTFSEFKNKPAPKSLDNNWIKDSFIEKMNVTDDGESNLATVSNWIAEQIAEQIEISTRERQMLITGGGAHNGYLIELISDKLKIKNCKVVIPEPSLIDFKEAILMAYMAYLRVEEKHNVLSMVTNASSDTIAGAYYKY